MDARIAICRHPGSGPVGDTLATEVPGPSSSSVRTRLQDRGRGVTCWVLDELTGEAHEVLARLLMPIALKPALRYTEPQFRPQQLATTSPPLYTGDVR